MKIVEVTPDWSPAEGEFVVVVIGRRPLPKWSERVILFEADNVAPAIVEAIDLAKERALLLELEEVYVIRS